MKKTLADRAQQILSELQITQVELAKMAGCTKGAVNQWLKASNVDSVMSPEYAFNLADKTNYEPRWLMIGEGPEKRIAIDKREQALLDLYRATDERGQTTILRAAESESSYMTAPDADTRKSA